MSEQDVRDEWNHFVAEVEPQRSRLFHYCLSLTKNPFDAEDLVSETLIKTFVSRAFTSNNVESPGAFLIRVASRLWIDEWRRRAPGTQGLVTQDETASETVDLTEMEDGVGALYGALNPIQRAIFVLKEVYQMSHKEIAATLSISPENARVVLHRAKEVLTDEDLQERIPRSSKALVEKFIEAFMSHDVTRVTSLMLDEVETSVFPEGREFASKDKLEWLKSAFSIKTHSLELRYVLGEPAILIFRMRDGDEQPFLEEVWMLEESHGKIARIVDYGYTPYVVSWVATFCGVVSRGVQIEFH